MTQQAPVIIPVIGSHERGDALDTSPAVDEALDRIEPDAEEPLSDRAWRGHEIALSSYVDELIRLAERFEARHLQAQRDLGDDVTESLAKRLETLRFGTETDPRIDGVALVEVDPTSRLLLEAEDDAVRGWTLPQGLVEDALELASIEPDTP